MQEKRREWGYILAHCGQQRAQRLGTALGTTINSCHNVDGERVPGRAVAAGE